MASISQQMKFYCDRLGGVHKHLNQEYYINRFNLANKNGVCHALCMLYLSQGPGAFGQGKGFEATWQWVDKMQSICNSPDNTAGTMGIIPKRTEKAMEVVGLSVKGLNHGRLIGDGGKVLNYFKQQNGGKFIMLLPSHAIAIHAINNEWRLFDPNGGQASFKSHEKLKYFIEQFLGDRVISEDYNLDNNPILIVTRVG